jgi:cell division protease FtsH
VTPPNREGREAILRVHAKDKPLANPDDIKVIADRTTGMSGAELAEVMNEAAIQAVREGKDKITLDHMSEAIDTVLMGPQMKSRVLNAHEKEMTAYHEAGHSIVAKALPANGELQKVTILPRGRALGVTWAIPTNDEYSKSKQDLRDKICMCMGGAAGELRKEGQFGTGPSNDFEKATQYAEEMVMTYGMSDELGKTKWADPRSRDTGHVPSPETQAKIDHEIQTILNEEFDRAKSILEKYNGAWEKLSQALIEKEELNRPELDALLKDDFGGGPSAPPAPPATPPAAPSADDKKAA